MLFRSISPSDAVETEAAIKAVAEYVGPCYVRLGRMGVNVINDNADYKFEIGKGVQLRTGSDVTIVATGIMVDEAITAEKMLKAEGISANVINIHTLKPLDTDILVKAAKETKAIVTAEEHSIIGGLGSAVSEALSEVFPVPVIKVGVMDTFGESGQPAELLKAYGLTAEKIVEAAKKAISMK